MLLDLFPFFRRTVLPARFEESVFAVVARHVTDKRALGEELAGVENIRKIPPAEGERRQKAAGELYLLLERNISEEQTRGRVSPQALREEIARKCHPERAEGNFALLFLPHYERQVKLFERFTNLCFERARAVLGAEGYTAFMKTLYADQVIGGIIKNGAISWRRLRKPLANLPPAVMRDAVVSTLKRAFAILTRQLVAMSGEVRTELLFQDVYRRYHNALDFLEAAPKVLVLVPDGFLEDERIELMGKAELTEELRMKRQALETTLAQVQGERLKLSELSHKELENKVQERTAELVSALEDAEKARKNLEEFSSLATHELRSPVAAIKGYLNLIASDEIVKLDANQRKYLELANQAGERLLVLVNAMLNVSRVELGTLAIEPMPIYIPDVADAVLADLAPTIREKGQVVTKRYDRTVPVVNLDPSLIRAIFGNLLTNATKYTGEGGKITVSIEKQSPDVLITIADNGYGIPKDSQPRIFEKMFRADNVRAKVAEGTGLGLYLVKSVLDQTGGKIWFESEENKGTKFFVTIPLSGMKRKEGVRGLS